MDRVDPEEVQRLKASSAPKDSILADLLNSCAQELMEEQEKALARKGVAKKKGEGPGERAALMKAVSEKNEAVLKNLLAASGCDPNFLMGRGGVRLTPLCLAVRQNWKEGVEILLSFGAEETDELFAEDKRRKWPRALETSANRSLDPAIFRMLLRAEKSPDRAKAACQYALTHSSACFSVALDIFGAKALPNNGNPFSLGNDHMNFNFNLRGGTAEDLECIKKAIRIFPGETSRPESALRLWAIAIVKDDVELASALATAGCSLASKDPSREDWSIPYAPQTVGVFDILNWSAPEMSPPRLRRQIAKMPHGDHANVNFQPSALAFAAWCESPKMVRMFAKSASLVSKTKGDPDSASLLACCQSREALKELKVAGFDLASLSDPETRLNPLHRMVIGSHAKTNLLDALALCPEWGNQTDAEGKTPAMLCDDPEDRAALEFATGKRLLPKGARVSKKNNAKRSL